MRTDFTFEFNSEVPQATAELQAETEQRLRDLAEGHTDLIGAAVAVEDLTKTTTPHRYQARVVAYCRPEPVAAVEKSDVLETALRGAVAAIERQIRERRAKLGQPWQRPDQHS